jgi:transmembrane sensor
LGASSHIDVDLGMSERRIALTRGEAFFEVSRDASRPFFVTAGGTVVRVVGTKFDVNYGTETVRVSVLEGRVELLKASGDHAQATTVRQVLTSGTAAVTDRAGEIVTTRSVNLGDLGVWRQSHLVYVDTRLRDVVADINRYYKGKIELADESTGDLQLTTAFRVDQIDRMIDVLESALPIETTRTADGRIILSQRLPKP